MRLPGGGEQQASAGRNTRRGRKAAAAARRWGPGSGREAPSPRCAGPGPGACSGRGPRVSWAGVSAPSREPTHLLSSLGCGRRRSRDQGHRRREVAAAAPEKIKKVPRPRGCPPLPPPPAPSPGAALPPPPAAAVANLPPLPLAHGAASAAGVDADSAPEPPLLPRGRRRRPPGRQPSRAASPGLPGTSARRRPRASSRHPIGGKERAGPPHWPGPHIERANGSCGFRSP